MGDQNNEAVHARAAKVIADGGVIAFRTDTFYGLGADPFNAVAVRKILELKGREENKPILVLLADWEDVDRFIVDRSELFNGIAKRFWPGPLTIVGKAVANLPRELTAGTGTIGLRLPVEATVRNFLAACGGALTATSANLSNEPAARSAKEVEHYFPNLDLIVDGGEVTATKPSTVIDLTGPELKIVREGAISSGALLARAEKGGH